MQKTILLTGATDGIGFETAKLLVLQGHKLLIHGRSASKLGSVKGDLSRLNREVEVETFCADLSNLIEVEELASDVAEKFSSIDVLINNAGVFKTPLSRTQSGIDIRFMVNAIAPYVLTQRLLKMLGAQGRVINLSSAAQASVNLDALRGKLMLSDSAAYAQSKLAITMWTFQLANILGDSGPAMIAVNPASFLGSKMVKEAYGSEGKDLHIGAKVLERAATSREFSSVSGKYFDNDIGDWASPHPDALDNEKNNRLVAVIQALIGK